MATKVTQEDLLEAIDGMEARAALDSGQVLVSRRAGTVLSVTAERIQIEPKDGAVNELDEYRLDKFVRSNQGTWIPSRPRRVASRSLSATRRSPRRSRCASPRLVSRKCSSDRRSPARRATAFAVRATAATSQPELSSASARQWASSPLSRSASPVRS